MGSYDGGIKRISVPVQLSDMVPKMSGRIFAKLEVDWILGTDEHSDKWRNLSGNEAKLYITLWCLAVSNRKEKIKRPSNSLLASMSGLRPRSIPDNLAAVELQGLCKTLVEDGLEYVVVFQVSKKHPQFNILGFQMKSNEIIHANENENRIEGEQKEKENNTCAPKPERDPAEEPKPKKHPNFQPFKLHFCERYQQTQGKKYAFQGAKDAEATKRLVGALPDLDDLKKRLEEFFEDKLEWMMGKSDHSISIFATQINKYGKADKYPRNKGAENCKPKPDEIGLTSAQLIAKWEREAAEKAAQEKAHG